MATIEFITKADLEQFKKELFAELRRPSLQVHKQAEQKEWLRSYEVRKTLKYLCRNISGSQKEWHCKIFKDWGPDVLQI